MFATCNGKLNTGPTIPSIGGSSTTEIPSRGTGELPPLNLAALDGGTSRQRECTRPTVV